MKKRITGLLTLIFIMSGIFFFGTSGNKVLAAEGNVTKGDGFIAVEYNNLSGFRGENKKIAPSAPSNYANYIFAGWYKDAECKQAFSNVAADTTLAYAKFVSENILSVKAQLKAGTTDASATTNMRLVSSVDSLNYKNVGYEIYYDGAEKPIKVNATKVYQRIVASEKSGVDYNYGSKVVDVESEYFVTATLLNIKKDNFVITDTLNFNGTKIVTARDTNNGQVVAKEVSKSFYEGMDFFKSIFENGKIKAARLSYNTLTNKGAEPEREVYWYGRNNAGKLNKKEFCVILPYGKEASNKFCAENCPELARGI